MTAPDRPYRRWTRLGVVAAVACGLCCAVPLLAVFGGIGVLGSLGVVFAVVEPVSIALMVIAVAGAGVLWLRRHRRSHSADRHADGCRCSPGAAGSCR